MADRDIAKPAPVPKLPISKRLPEKPIPGQIPAARSLNYQTASFTCLPAAQHPAPYPYGIGRTRQDTAADVPTIPPGGYHDSVNNRLAVDWLSVNMERLMTPDLMRLQQRIDIVLAKRNMERNEGLNKDSEGDWEMVGEDDGLERVVAESTDRVRLTVHMDKF